MRNAAQIVESVLGLIGSVYRRPLMHGEDAGEVDTLLWHLHWLLLDGQGHDNGALIEARMSVHGRHCCNVTFAAHYRHCTKNGATATEDQVIASVIHSWQKVDAQLGIVLPAWPDRPADPT